MAESIGEIKEHTIEMMDNSISSFIEDLKTFRTGRASLAVLDQIRIESYGNQMPISQLATLSIPEPRSIVIEPWDKAVIKDIEKALMKSDLNLTPNSDGNLIRLNFPPLTEERRQDFVKQIKNRAEQAKVSIRNVRKDSNEHIKKIEKDGHISKDEVKDGHDEIQKLTDQYIVKVTQLTEKKEKEIMEI